MKVNHSYIDNTYQTYGWNGEEWEVLGPRYKNLKHTIKVGVDEFNCHSRLKKMIVVQGIVLDHSKFEQEYIVYKNF